MTQSFTENDLEELRQQTQYLSPCRRIKNEWDWKAGEHANERFGGVPQFERNYFDCGNYFFDGEFNVVKFEKGMTLYHGSAALANYVAEYPIGPEFYKANETIKNGQLSKQDVMKDHSIQTMLTTKNKISPSWYADLHVGKIYSGQVNDPTLMQNCTGKCINAYKTKKDIILLLLDDDYNIAKLYLEITKQNKIEELKRLETMFGINRQSFNKTNDKNPFKRFQINKNRQSRRDIDLPFADFLMEKYIIPKGYSGYGATATPSSVHYGGEFHLEIILSNPPMLLKRDLENPYDWQYSKKQQTEDQKKFFNSMKMFKSYNTDFHSGDLLEHSIWSLLYTEKLLESDLFPDALKDKEIIKKVISFASLIHDIGKFHSDEELNGVTFNNQTNTFVYRLVDNHPEYGYKMVMGEMPIPIYSIENNQLKTDFLTFKQLFDIFLPELINDIDREIYTLLIAFIIRNHWLFGKWLSGIKININEQDYKKFIQDLIHVPGLACHKDFHLIIISLIIVSLSDIYGTQPYGIERLSKGIVQDVNKCSRYFNFCNRPKKYKGVDLLKLNGGQERVMRITKYLIEYIYNNKPKYTNILCPVTQDSDTQDSDTQDSDTQDSDTQMDIDNTPVYGPLGLFN